MTIFYEIDDLEACPIEGLQGLKSFPCGELAVRLMTPMVRLPEDTLRARLHPNELSRAHQMGSQTRRQEFMRSRFLIHTLLCLDDEIVNDPSGFIIWPQRTRGSLTHKDHLIALSIVPESSYWGQGGLGVDMEETSRVHRGLEPKILLKEESVLLENIAQENSTNTSLTFEKLLALVFSFKESVYKAIYPVGKRFFYFDKFQVSSLDFVRGKVSGKLLFDGSEKTPLGFPVEGSFVFLKDKTQEWVFTSVILKNEN